MRLAPDRRSKHREPTMDSRLIRPRAFEIAKPTRRSVVQGAAALAASGLTFPAAHAATALNAVWWGGPWIEAIKAVTAKQNEVEVNWQLHAGGSAAVLPKIKSAWPSYQYDIVSSFTPVYPALIKEGWCEPLTVQEIPNLKEVPDVLIFRNAQNEIMNAPMTLTGKFWGYRKDTSPIQLENLDQLLSPKLKGQICWWAPTYGGNLHLVSLALHKGGSEKNLEPGWQFLKEIAKAGNIGRVANTESDFINSVTTGETSVSIANLSNWQTIVKTHPCAFLSRESKPGLQTFIYSEGCVILKNSPNKAAAKRFLNFLLSAENDEEYCKRVGQAPVNRNAKPGDIVKPIAYTTDEVAKLTYSADFQLLSSQLDAMQKRFETEIAPLL
jgi:putative spermidine/putrescine transport system substrate-binding protein